MSWLIGLFTQNKFARQAGALALVALSFVTFGAIKKREGRKQERADMKEADNERATNIRRRVDAANELHDTTDRGYRD